MSLLRAEMQVMVQKASSPDDLYENGNISNLEAYSWWYDEVAKMYCLRAKKGGDLLAFHPDEFEQLIEMLESHRTFEDDETVT